MKLARIFEILKEAEMDRSVPSLEAPAIPASDTAPADSTQPKTIDQVWEENKTTAKTYISKEEFAVKQNGANFEVYSIVGTERKLYQNMDQATLAATLVKARETDAPDAEGFVTYLRPNKVEAFKFDGDSSMVLIDNRTIALVRGDYVVKSVVNNKFIYSIENQFEFENTMELTQ